MAGTGVGYSNEPQCKHGVSMDTICYECENEELELYYNSKRKPLALTDNVNSPPHYKDIYPFEVIEMIKKMLTKEQFEGYCLGNEIKYRMRAGIKNSETLVEDIKKAEWYNNTRVRAALC